MTGLDLTAFLHILDWSCGLVRTSEQLARAAYNVAAREARAGAGYADLIVNPTHWSAWRQRLDAFVDALDAGFAQAETDGLPPIGLCISLLRQQRASEALELARTSIEASFCDDDVRQRLLVSLDAMATT